MTHLLSIQSHVSYGYAGNRSAVFPLQRLGFDVSAIHTVQFSNHTGYGAWEGQVFSTDHIAAVARGIDDRMQEETFASVLSGYLGSKEIGQATLDIVKAQKTKNPSLLYCCDPVMGDEGRGFFVREGVPEFFLEQALPMADILTPNHFEMEFLSETKIRTPADIEIAISNLEKKSNFKVLLITSLRLESYHDDSIACLLYSKDHRYLTKTPRLPFPIPPNGCGDLIAALFLGQLILTNDAASAFQNAVSAVYAILKATFEKKRREIDLIGSQANILSPDHLFDLAQF